MLYKVQADVPEVIFKRAVIADSLIKNNKLLIAAVHAAWPFTFLDPSITPRDLIIMIESEYQRRVQNGRFITIGIIRPKWAYTSMRSTTFKDKPDAMFFNARRKWERESDKPTTVTILHETLHVFGFGHGNNFNQDKEPKLSSVPIKLARTLAMGV
jgi:hypothetical protein